MLSDRRLMLSNCQPFDNHCPIQFAGCNNRLIPVIRLPVSPGGRGACVNVSLDDTSLKDMNLDVDHY